MSLMSVNDFKAASKLTPAMSVAQVTPARLRAGDTTRLMPPVTSSKLAPAELATLDDWIAGGAAPAAGACAVTEAPLQPTAAGSGAPTMPVGPRSGGASLEPQQYDDPDMKCYKFLTHAQGNFDAPFMQGPGEQYVNFSFKAPWTGDVYLRSIQLHVENAPVLHHWLLFKDPRAKTHGAIQQNASGTHTDGAVLLHGWAPGASPIYYDPDVGMKLESGSGLTLEAHFYNAGTGAKPDHSGAEVCVTPKVPAHVVDISWVGTDRIAGTSATGNCSPVDKSQPIHIIAAQPHLHKAGVHQKVVLNRRDGTKDIVHDADFGFDDQRYWLKNTVLMPGDTLTTTCTYNKPSTFGSSTDTEMCYFFTIAWPAGSLGSYSVIHGANTCMD
jgi:hypothetical protein